MKVKELIKELKQLNPDLEVGFAYPTGDYWHTRAVRVVENAEEQALLVDEGGHDYPYQQPLNSAGDMIEPDEEDETVKMVVLEQWG